MTSDILGFNPMKNLYHPLQALKQMVEESWESRKRSSTRIRTNISKEIRAPASDLYKIGLVNSVIRLYPFLLNYIFY